MMAPLCFIYGATVESAPGGHRSGTTHRRDPMCGQGAVPEERKELSSPSERVEEILSG